MKDYIITVEQVIGKENTDYPDTAKVFQLRGGETPVIEACKFIAELMKNDQPDVITKEKKGAKSG